VWSRWREDPARGSWLASETGVQVHLCGGIGLSSRSARIPRRCRGRLFARICRTDLIVVDGIGMLPAGQDAAEAFYRITDAAHERRSVAVTSNIHPGWLRRHAQDPGGATGDRLLHCAHVVLAKGDSHRLAGSSQAGVIPLAT
jgi:hypothetical protein